MESRRDLRMYVIALILLFAPSLFAQTADKPTESIHREGPHGLEGWTLDSPLPDSQYEGERFAFTLVLARKGRVLRRFEGDPIIWKWMFWADGRQVAYETGPLHFSMNCVLLDVETGRQIEDYDCYHMPDNEPDWVIALENTR
jgi:hypothetical protein